jgi:hypothetical protein
VHPYMTRSQAAAMVVKHTVHTVPLHLLLCKVTRSEDQGRRRRRRRRTVFSSLRGQ